MSLIDALDVVDVGDGKWDVQIRDSLLVVGCVWRTSAGYVSWDWADQQIGVFDSMAGAVGALWTLEGSR